MGVTGSAGFLWEGDGVCATSGVAFAFKLGVRGGRVTGSALICVTSRMTRRTPRGVTDATRDTMHGGILPDQLKKTFAN